MSQCPQCYTGTCKRHKRQDHGKSVAQPANPQQTLQKMYDMLVGTKLQKLQAEAVRNPSKEHTAEFRQQLDATRDKSIRKSSKKRFKSTADAAGSGLNPQAFAAINNDSSDSDSDSEKKKSKKKRKSKKDRKSESSSSSRKSKHSKKHKRRRSDSESDEDSEDNRSKSSDSDSEGSSDDSRLRSSSSRKRSSRSNRRKISKKKSKRRRKDSE